MGLYAACFGLDVILGTVVSTRDEEPFLRLSKRLCSGQTDDEVALLATAYFRFVLLWTGTYILIYKSGIEISDCHSDTSEWLGRWWWWQENAHAWFRTKPTGNNQTTWSYCYKGINNANKH